MRKEFKTHLLNEKGLKEIKEIAGIYNELLNVICALVPESRELTIAKTKLEEACFFSKKAVAGKEDNHKQGV